MAKYLDLDGLTYYKAKEDLLLANKVDKETGKGLSTNDYTTAEKTKLSGIETAAEVNVLEGVQLNGTTITPTNKIANIEIDVPTKTSDLTNDSGFITSSALGGYVPTSRTINSKALTNNITLSASDVGALSSSTTYVSSVNGSSGAVTGIQTTSNLSTSISSSSTDTQYPSALAVKTYVDDSIGTITGLSFEVVQSLPSTGSAGVIYLVSNSGSGTNIYDEYVWLSSSSSFEKIGTTDVDLSNYVQFSDLIAITTGEIDTLFA